MTDEYQMLTGKLLISFKKMMQNEDKGHCWKNIPLAKEAFAMMKELPDTLAEEFETPADKAGILSNMLHQLYETNTPRFSLEVRRHIQQLNPDDKENLKGLEKLEDFLNLDFPMEDYCKKYNVHLYFDPVERTEEWESVVYDMEKALDKKFRFTRRHMGFCFRYWSAKKSLLKEKYNIDWSTPSQMNPNVIFD